MSGATMVAGRALDAVVAERVMGWTRVVGPCAENNGEAFGAPPELIADGTLPKDHGRVRVPHYSTDIAAAWLVVERMDGDGVETGEVWHRWNRAIISVLHDAPSLAAKVVATSICLAALAAHGAEVAR